jgi:hypothetical protein
MAALSEHGYNFESARTSALMVRLQCARSKENPKSPSIQVSLS